ncbi:MAG: hypothetical protein IJ547_03420, partial [Clostridia bacterium]|nr:hypothetical protein [Clostridia bacterium]
METPDFTVEEKICLRFIDVFLPSPAKDAEAHSPLVRALRYARPQLTWKRLISLSKKKYVFVLLMCFFLLRRKTPKPTALWFAPC